MDNYKYNECTASDYQHNYLTFLAALLTLEV